MTEGTGRRRPPAARTPRDDPDRVQALVEQHLGLVRRIARRHAAREEDVDDLFQEGVVGLLARPSNSSSVRAGSGAARLSRKSANEKSCLRKRRSTSSAAIGLPPRAAVAPRSIMAEPRSRRVGQAGAEAPLLVIAA